MYLIRAAGLLQHRSPETSLANYLDSSDLCFLFFFAGHCLSSHCPLGKLVVRTIAQVLSKRTFDDFAWPVSGRDTFSSAGDYASFLFPCTQTSSSPSTVYREGFTARGEWKGRRSALGRLKWRNQKKTNATATLHTKESAQLTRSLVPFVFVPESYTEKRSPR